MRPLPRPSAAQTNPHPVWRFAEPLGKRRVATEKGAVPMTQTEKVETMETLSLRLREAEAQMETMRAIVRRVAEARMCRDTVTMIESCPHCSLKRGGEHGYSGKHDPTCIVTLARGLGF